MLAFIRCFHAQLHILEKSLVQRHHPLQYYDNGQRSYLTGSPSFTVPSTRVSGPSMHLYLATAGKFLHHGNVATAWGFQRCISKTSDITNYESNICLSIRPGQCLTANCKRPATLSIK